MTKRNRTQTKVKALDMTAVYRWPYRFALCAGVVSSLWWGITMARAAEDQPVKQDVAAKKSSPAPAPAASTAPATTEVDRTDSTYPQTFNVGDYEVVKYQPQIDEWKDFKLLKARMAVAIQKKNSQEEPKYVSIEFEADTTVDKEAGVVHVGPRRVNKLVFVDAKDKAEEAELKKILEQTGDAQTPMKVDLAAMVAMVDESEVMNRNIEVNYDPPPIFYSEEPAIMLSFMGDPDFKAVDPKTNKVLFALNTNWDVLMDVASATYYLLIEDGWLQTKNVEKGPWEIVKTVPASFSSLPDDDNWTNVRKALKADPFETVPKVFFSNQPSELIETTGKPSMKPIPGTALMEISNTESDIFFLTTDSNYYYLVNGRWFRSKQLTGGWAAATLDLPAEFAKIPKDHEKAYVLASVKGTEVADEAAVLASIPETATVDRKEVKLSVEYDGDPKFEEIKGSQSVQTAVNTQKDVFLSNGKYYCCYQGVWFVGNSANGPWDVCDAVDKNIYTIPASAPQHNVTYVQVYNTTPTTVQYGYTAGYTGQYLVNGLLLFGAGYWLGSYHNHYHYHSYIGWGCGARWGYHGGYHRPCHWGYGPYGGHVRPVPYHGGRYHRPHHYYGNHRPGYSRPGYSPWRPQPGHRPSHRPGVRPTPYGHWGNKAKLDNRMARKRYDKLAGSKLRPVTRPVKLPNLRPITRPGKPGVKPGLRPGVRPGNRPSIQPVKPGVRPGTRPSTRPATRPDVYVGKNGQIYKKDKSGKWQQRDKSGWKDSKIPTRPSTRPGAGGGGIKPGVRPAVKPAVRPGGGGSGIKPGVRPGVKPSVRPGVKPAVKPAVRPKVTRPSVKKPVTRPSTSRPSVTRPKTTRPSVSRPTTRPTTRPSVSRPSYKSTRSTGRKLNYDSRTRARSHSNYRPPSRASRPTPTRSARSRTSHVSRPSRPTRSAPSRARSGGGRRR